MPTVITRGQRDTLARTLNESTKPDGTLAFGYWDVLDRMLRAAGLEVEKTPEERIEAFVADLDAYYECEITGFVREDREDHGARAPEGDDFNAVLDMVEKHFERRIG